jgi:hypothetical protein
VCPCGGTGRRAGLKIRCPQGRVGSIPTGGTNKKSGFKPDFLLVFLVIEPKVRKIFRKKILTAQDGEHSEAGRAAP